MSLPPTNKRTRVTKTFETDGQKLQIVKEEEEEIFPGIPSSSGAGAGGGIDVGEGDHYTMAPRKPSKGGGGGDGGQKTKKKKKRLRSGDDSDDDACCSGGGATEPPQHHHAGAGGGGEVEAEDEEDKMFLQQMSVMASNSAAKRKATNPQHRYGLVPGGEYDDEDEYEEDEYGIPKDDDNDSDGRSAAAAAAGGQYGFGTLGDGGIGSLMAMMSSSQYITADEMSEKLVRPKESCWGCDNAFRAQRQPGANPAADHLVELKTLNEATMSKPELAKLIGAAYDRLVYNPAILRGECPMSFTPAQVLRHLMYHERSIASTMQDAYFRANDIMVTLNDSVLVRDGAGCKVDMKNFAAFKESMNALLKLGTELRRNGGTS